MGITIQIKEKDGVLHTRVIEAEGAMKAVRNYANPADAIAYLTKQALMYKQPALPAGQGEKGTKVTDSDGDEATNYSLIAPAIALLSGKQGEVPESKKEPKKDADEPKPEASPAAPEPGEAAAGEEGKEGKPEGEPATPPAPAPEPATPPATPATAPNTPLKVEGEDKE